MSLSSIFTPTKCHLFLSAVSVVAILVACEPVNFDTEHGELVVRDGSARTASSVSDAVPRTKGVGEPVLEAALVPAKSSKRRPAPKARAGVVTAADIDDTLNLDSFLRYQTRMAKQTKLPRLNLGTPIQVDFGGGSASGAGINVSLRKSGSAEPFYSGTTGVDGKLTVFPAILGAGHVKDVELSGYVNGHKLVKDRFTIGKTVRPVRVYQREDYKPEFLDLVFVFDTTGSMGDELAWLTKEFSGIVQQARNVAPQANMRFGLVAYRDQGDAYVVKNFGFTGRLREMQKWLRGLDANGGGDYPEAADAALMAATELPWRRGYGERLVFHIADAPPHKSGARRYLEAARKAASKNVQIFGLGASGVAEEAEFMMRQAAVATNGRYLFLTDDSGIGHAHSEPNTACYQVTRLKGLLTRVITSELTGIRQEAASRDVIRSVGNYRRGTCVQ
ncbi:MAG: vWA domain-containing protein [Aliishimia sp.]